MNFLRNLGVLCIMTASCAAAPSTALRDGDIIFQTSQSSQSVAIQRATASPYSHMGIIFFRNHRPYVLEASATVRYTPLDDWIARGKGGHYVVKRLKDASALNAEGTSKLRSTAAQLLGRPYDLTFEWSDDRVYCSELVWKIYDRALHVDIGELSTSGISILPTHWSKPRCAGVTEITCHWKKQSSLPAQCFNRLF